MVGAGGGPPRPGRRGARRLRAAPPALALRRPARGAGCAGRSRRPTRPRRSAGTRTRATCRPRACSRPPPGMSCAEYLREAVLAPLAMDASLGLAEADEPRTARVWQPGRYGDGRALQRRALPPRRAAAVRRVRDARSPTGRSSGCLLARGGAGGGALLAPETVDEMLAPQFGPLPGGVGGVGEWPDLCWGLGFDVRGRRDPHWAGASLSERAASHSAHPGRSPGSIPSAGWASSRSPTAAATAAGGASRGPRSALR